MCTRELPLSRNVWHHLDKGDLAAVVFVAAGWWWDHRVEPSLHAAGLEEVV